MDGKTEGEKVSAVITNFDPSEIVHVMKAVTTQSRNAKVKIRFDLVNGQAKNVMVIFKEAKA